jgi:hypothetical protein
MQEILGIFVWLDSRLAFSGPLPSSHTSCDQSNLIRERMGRRGRQHVAETALPIV